MFYASQLQPRRFYDCVEVAVGGGGVPVEVSTAEKSQEFKRTTKKLKFFLIYHNILSPPTKHPALLIILRD